jgi:putative ABC transport system permease protein
MLKNLIQHSLRMFRRQKGYVFINIVGLSVGIACSLLIALYVIHEASFDQFHEKKDLIHRVNLHGRLGGQEAHVAYTATPIGPAMREEFPEVEDFCRIDKWGETVVRYEDNTFTEDAFILADSSFFNMFSFPLLRGDRERVLNARYKVVLSESTAKKIFGEEDPIGKMIKVGTDSLYVVTGIMADFPNNSHFHANMVGSFVTNPRANDGFWLSNSFGTYVLLREGASPSEVNSKFHDLLVRNVGPQLEVAFGVSFDDFIAAGNQYSLEIQPLLDIHLSPGIDHPMKPSTDPRYLYIFGVIAILIVVIASINFMNLSTAQATKRAREVGIKKVSGSSRGMLVRQFLAESVFLSLLSLMFSLVLLELTLPWFNNLLQTKLHLDYFGNWYTVPGLLVFSILVGLLSGSYPSFVLSSFKPVAVLKGRVKDTLKNGSLRSILVVLQFAISITLIIGTMIIFKQISYMLNKDLGFNKEHLMVVRRASVLEQQVGAFKEELLKIPGVMYVSASTALPTVSNNNNGYALEGRGQESFLLETSWADHDFLNTFGISLSEGRYFDPERKQDEEGCIVNQTAAAKYDLKIDESRFANFNNEGQIESYMPVIGITGDFHFRSLREEISPYLIQFKNENMNWGYLTLRLSADAPSDIVKRVETLWKEFANNDPLQYFFMDESLKRMYNQEQQNASLAILFTILAIVIASLGLLGLTSFLLEQRTKEIGIRKAMGASMSSIFLMITKELVLLVSISALIAIPVVYFVAKDWLQNFYYRITPGVADFLLGFLIALVIAILTISFRTLKAARLNPANSLRYE